MKQKLLKYRNRIMVYSVLIAIINVFSKNSITDFYKPVVLAITSGGLLLSLWITHVLNKQQEDEHFYMFVDTISIVWVFFLVFYFSVSFVLFPARVNGSSMTPNFDDNDVILVWKLQSEFEFGNVVFVNVTEERTNHTMDEYFLKRIIGTPGDKVEHIGNILYINNVPTEEDYINTFTQEFSFEDVCFIKDVSCENVIPDDYYLVLGDNRNNSVDSRIIGLIHKDDLFGKVIFNVMRFETW